MKKNLLTLFFLVSALLSYAQKPNGRYSWTKQEGDMYHESSYVFNTNGQGMYKYVFKFYMQINITIPITWRLNGNSEIIISYGVGRCDFQPGPKGGPETNDPCKHSREKSNTTERVPYLYESKNVIWLNSLEFKKE